MSLEEGNGVINWISVMEVETRIGMDGESRISKEGESGIKEERLYEILSSDVYSKDDYRRESLGEEMEVINQLMGGWWKPRFLLNHRLKRAYEWMNSHYTLMMVDSEDIDWESMKKLKEDPMDTLKAFSFMFPSFILNYKNGIAAVKWQLNPNGFYWMDDDGYGMTADNEVNVYGFIDTEGKVISKFHYYTDREILAGVLDLVHNEAVDKVIADMKESR